MVPMHGVREWGCSLGGGMGFLFTALIDKIC